MISLEDAVNSLYKTFARYPRPQTIEFCQCGCTKPDATAVLVVAPLCDLRFSDLADYSFRAMTTQGSLNDFRYLLPRLFQGITEEEYGYNPETLFCKLDYAKWITWPKDEVDALREFLCALWETGLTSFPLEDRLPAFFEIETLLASIAVTREDLRPYLEVWAETRTRQSDHHLIQFVTFYGTDFSAGRTLNEAFWANAKPQADTLRNWLIRADTFRRIEDSAHLLPQDGYEHLFPPALEVLRREARSA